LETKKQTIIIVLIAVIATAGIAVGITYVLVVPTPGTEAEVDALEIILFNYMHMAF